MDTIKLNVPLLIRLLELSREELTTDVQIHIIAEHMVMMKQDCFTMKDYSKIVSVLGK